MKFLGYQWSWTSYTLDNNSGTSKYSSLPNSVTTAYPIYLTYQDRIDQLCKHLTFSLRLPIVLNASFATQSFISHTLQKTCSRHSSIHHLGVPFAECYMHLGDTYDRLTSRAIRFSSCWAGSWIEFPAYQKSLWDSLARILWYSLSIVILQIEPLLFCRFSFMIRFGW